MKAKIVSVALAGLFILGNVGMGFAGNKEIYKNIDKNEAEKTVTTEIFDGESDANLRPLGKHTVRYSDDGNLIEKTNYKWDSEKGWIAQSKYDYYYDIAGNMSALEYVKWNEKENGWGKDSYLTMYIHTSEGELLTINE